MTQPDETIADAIRVEYGRTYFLRTAARHVLRLPPDWMTIVFAIDPAERPTDGHPRYVLRSTDGAYAQSRSASDDLVPGDTWLQLVFDGLLPGREYVLERFDDAERSVVVFERLPFDRIVDQPRALHDTMPTYGIVDALVCAPSEAIEDWV